MREIILLGAGASVEAGVPGAFDMTQRLIALFGNDPRLLKHSHVLRFAVGGLLFEQGINGNNPFNGVDVEALFKNPSKKLGELISEMIKIPFEKLKKQRPRDNYNFKSELSKLTKPKNILGGGQVFEETTELMTQMLAEIVWLENTDKVSYLLPLFSCAEQDTLTIASLNYDNGIELAAESAGIPVETGIEAWSQSRQFPQIEKGVQLLKLHGSIDWSLKDGQCTSEKPLPHQVIKKVSAEEMKQWEFKPAIIFGQRNKLTAKGPFLDLLRTFQQELNNSARLTVIGYSFRDEHINELIAQWLNEDQKRNLRIINGKRFKDTNVPFAHDLLTVLGNDRLDVITSYAADGIRDCFS